MSESTPSRPPGPRPLRPVDVWLGMLAFGAGSIVVSIFAPVGFDPLAGVIYALVVAGLVGLAYFRLGWRGFAAGVAGGFVLSTLASGGSCTLFAPPGEAELAGFGIYAAALLLGGIGVAAYEGGRASRRAAASSRRGAGMSGPNQESPPPAPFPLRPIDVWLGVVAFGASNFVVIFFLQGFESLGAGVLYGLVILAVVLLMYFVLGSRGFAVGIAGGFVVLTVVSGGACTLFTDLSTEGGDRGAAVYWLAVIVGGLAVAVHALVRRARRR